MTIYKEQDSSVPLDLHHMMPKHASYFSELSHLRNDPYFSVSLTKEGHGCQHDILAKVFGEEGDVLAARMLYGQSRMSPEARRRQIEGSGSGKPHPDQVADMQRKGWESNSKPVILTHIATGKQSTYPSLHAAARAINGAASHLCNVIKGKGKSHKGYTAEYFVG